jgi:hypothetical protein
MRVSCFAAMARWYLTVVSATPAAAAIFGVGMPCRYISTHSGSGAVRFVWVIRLPVSSRQGVVLGSSSLLELSDRQPEEHDDEDQGVYRQSGQHDRQDRVQHTNNTESWN